MNDDQPKPPFKPERKSPPSNLKDVLADLKADYLKTLPAKIEKIKTLTFHQSWEQLADEYHKLKGTGKTYGFPEITLVCEKLEKLSQEKWAETKNQSHASPLSLPATEDNSLSSANREIPATDNPFLLAPKLLERLLRAYDRNEKFDLLHDSTAKKILL